MIRVTDRFYVGSTPEQRTITVDADDALVLSTSTVDGSVLVLLKGEEEVAWFEHWTSAVKVANLKEDKDG